MLRHIHIAAEICDEPMLLFTSGAAYVIAPWRNDDGKAIMAYVAEVRGYYPTDDDVWVLDVKKYGLPSVGSIWLQGTRLYTDKEDWSAQLTRISRDSGDYVFAQNFRHLAPEPIAFELDKKALLKAVLKTYKSWAITIQVTPSSLTMTRLLARKDGEATPKKRQIEYSAVYPKREFKPLLINLDPQWIRQAIDHLGAVRKLIVSSVDNEAPITIMGIDARVLLAPMRF